MKQKYILPSSSDSLYIWNQSDLIYIDILTTGSLVPNIMGTGRSGLVIRVYTQNM